MLRQSRRLIRRIGLAAFRLDRELDLLHLRQPASSAWRGRRALGGRRLGRNRFAVNLTAWIELRSLRRPLFLHGLHFRRLPRAVIRWFGDGAKQARLFERGNAFEREI